MSISSVAAFSAASTSVALSGIVAGDLLIAVAYRNASATAATIPSGWTAIAGATGGGSTNALAAAYKIAAGGETTSGVWTNATQVAVSQYRSSGGANAWKIGAGAATGATSTSASIPALTLQNTAAASWVFGAIGSKTDTTLASTAPTSMTRRTSVGTAGGLGAYDTAGTVASWAAVTKAVTSGAYRSVAVEFYEDVTPPTIAPTRGSVIGDGATAFSTTLVANKTVASWAIVAGSNAAGFSLNTATGALSLPAQTFAAGGNNARTVQITATDPAGNTSAATTYTLTVKDPAYRDWNPLTDLPAGTLAAWHDVNDSSTFDLSGGLVTQFRDKSGNGITLTGSAGSRPTYSAAGYNGLPAMIFDGSTTFLGTSGNVSTLPSGAANGTIVAVAQCASTPQGGSVLAGYGGGGGGNYRSVGPVYPNPTVGMGTIGFDRGGSYTWVGFDRIAVVEFNAADCGIWTDGNPRESFGATTLTTTSPSQYFIGKHYVYGMNWTGAVQEVFVINGILSDSDRQKLEGYLAWKWGLQGQLPAGHTYASAPPTVATGSGGTGGTTYTATMALGLTPSHGVAALLSGVSAAALAATPGLTTSGGAVYGASVPLAAAAALAGSPSVTAAVTAALAEVAGITGSAQTSAAAVLTLTALAGQSGSGGLTAASALTLAQAAGLIDTSAITAAQGAALAMALAAVASTGGASYASAMALAASAVAAVAGQGAWAGAASLQASPAHAGAAQLAAVGAAGLAQIPGAAATSSAILASAAALAEAVGAQASTGGAQAYAAAVSLAAQALAQASGSGSVAVSAPLSVSLGLSGAAAGLYAGAVALAQAEGQGAQAKAVAVAAAALAEVLGTDLRTDGTQAYTAAVALAASALQAATARTGTAALAALAASAGSTASGTSTGSASVALAAVAGSTHAGTLGANAAAALAASAGVSAQAALTIAASTTFQAATRVLATGGLVVTGTLTLPAVPGLAGQSTAAVGPSLAFTARLDQAAASTISGAAAAQLAAQAALQALLQVGDPYADLPRLQGLRTVTLTLEGRRLGMRTLAGTMQVTLTLRGTTRH
ncbi:hypothetical protein ACLBX9_27865 [Methylobacterium sp. A49B]